MRLIELDVAKKLFDDIPPFIGMTGKCVQEMLEKAPAVDAVILPPVKIGDTAFFIIKGTIHKAKICILQWYNHPRGIITEIRGEKIGGSVGASFSEWGKTVFATRKEAEAALDRMKGVMKNETYL